MIDHFYVLYDAFRSAIGGVEWFVAAYFACLTVFFVIGKDYMEDGFVYPFFFMALTIFNPILIIPVGEAIGLLPRIRRLFWLLPVNLTLAFVCTCAVSAPRKKLFRPLIAVILAFLIVKSGTSVRPYLQMPENIYKTTNTVIEISELLETDSIENGLEKHALYSSQQLLELRQYDPSIRSILRRSDLLDWSIDTQDEEAVNKVIQQGHVPHTLALVSRYGLHIDQEAFRRCLQRVGINYIITEPEMNLNGYLIDTGCSQIGTVDGYEIYRVELS